MKRNIFIFIAICFLSTYPFCGAFADHDENHEKKQIKNFELVSNETFKQECGACHFAYQPGLLPLRSWEKILSSLPSHFEEEVLLDEETKKAISDYLQDNAAEKSSSKIAKKIIKSLSGQTPLRITEIPYIQEKHHELDSRIYRRGSIGSRSNCIACHSSAEQGNYDDDFVKIPK